jgi:excinuclease ABC subunit C
LIDDKIVDSLPETPGVYLFKDGDGNIIYVGKAKSLKDRVRNYLTEQGKEPRLVRLIRSTDGLEIIATQSEREAFLLENNLIKEHRPKYNVDLKDDKSYASLKVTTNEPYPGLFVTRRIVEDGARYFGPYANVQDMRAVLKLVQAFYPIRRCKATVFRKRKRPCILFQIGKCLAPCSDKADAVRYGETVDELLNFLQGRNEEILKALSRRIEEESAKWNFEEARRLKERFDAIRVMTEKQRVHEHFGTNRDVWAFERGGKGILLVRLEFRKGLLIGTRHFDIVNPVSPFDDAVLSFLYQYYSGRPIPDELVLSRDLEDAQTLAHHLSQPKIHRVSVFGPKKRGAGDLIALALENLYGPALPLGSAFKRLLKLNKEPAVIEIFDISHTGGANPTGVMVAFEGFRAAKERYRVFHIKEASPLDDTAMMAEVLRRRLSDEKLPPQPDLIVLDGGKAQLSAVSRVMKELNRRCDLVAIAKGEGRKRLLETLHLPGRKNPLVLPRGSPVLKELVRMRDEAHRFALASHRRWKRKEDLAGR